MMLKFVPFSFVFLWFTAGIATSQELLQAVPESADLSSSAREKLQMIRGLASTETVGLVRVSPDELRSGSDLTIALGTGDVLNLEKTQLSQTADTQFVWNGRTSSALAMGGGIEGNATIAVSDGKVSASIRTSDGLFRLQPLGDGLHALIKIRQNGFPAEHPDVPQSPIQQRDLNRSELRQSGDNTVAEISILVAASDAAASKIDLETFAALAINISNQSFENSAVRARFTLAGVTTLSYLEAGSHEGDLENLVKQGDGVLDEVHELRNAKSADIVVLLNDDNSYCGLARDIYAAAPSAFATVYWECAVDNLSFPHEVGHLLGACHNPEVNPSCAPFSYGHGFMNPSRRVRTIMSYDCPQFECTRIPQWSAPPDWGDVSVSFDAKVIDETSPRAARFR